MENIVLNKVPSQTATPRNIVLDKIAVPPYTTATTAFFFWRFEDEPTSDFQRLGKQSVGFPLQIPIDTQGREIRISMIGVSEAGIQSTYDPREGVQTTFTPPSQPGSIVVYDGEVVTYNGEVVTHA